MLVDAGVKYVIIGHSERREYFKEDDAFLNKKVKKAIASGLTPILCCGETLEQREMGVTMDWIRLQIKSDLAGVAADDVKNLVIAYEQSGRSVQVRQLHLIRLRKYVRVSVNSSLRFMTQIQQRQFVFSTAVL